MKNIKVHAIVLALIIIAEMIGNVSFKIGVGTICTAADAVCPDYGYFYGT